MSRSTAANRPPLPRLVSVHHQLRGALDGAQKGRDVSALAVALAESRPDDAAGLATLLADLGVQTPTDLLETIRMLTLSAGYTALTWAGGLPTAGGRMSERDVLSTSWASVQWQDEEVDSPTVQV